MIKSSIIFLILLSTILSSDPSKGTQGFYLSLSSLAHQHEVYEALDKIKSDLVIDRTTYTKSGINYTIDNVTIITAFIDSQQKVEIIQSNNVKVSGDKFQFQYIFNYSKLDSGKQTNGYATGTVITDFFGYSKKLGFGKDQFLIWQLIDGTITTLTITNPLKIRRIQPYNDTDLTALEQLLDKAQSGVTPGTLKKQLLQKFNTIMPKALNSTLNLQVLGQQFTYSYQHSTKGQMNMTIIHRVADYSINPQDGYKVILFSQIKGQKQLICQGVDVPDHHLNWDIYGGTQSIQLICFYQQVLQYIQKNKWLDQKLNTDWDCNAFQFYAGDLFQLVSNLSDSVSPRQLVQINCIASPSDLVIKSGRMYQRNSLQVDATYTCLGTTRNKNLTYIDILNFTVKVRLIVKAQATQRALDFTIYTSDIVSMVFQQVKQFNVTNKQLALFKASQVLDQLRGVKIFGTGFPTLPRQMPAANVEDSGQYVVYYDKSQKLQKKQQLTQ